MIVGDCGKLLSQYKEPVYMKALIYLLIVIALALIGYNLTFVELDSLFTGDSATALAGILASSIVIVLMVILLMSRAISEKVQK